MYSGLSIGIAELELVRCDNGRGVGRSGSGCELTLGHLRDIALAVFEVRCWVGSEKTSVEEPDVEGPIQGFTTLDECWSAVLGVSRSKSGYDGER